MKKSEKQIKNNEESQVIARYLFSPRLKERSDSRSTRSPGTEFHSLVVSTKKEPLM